VNRLQTFANARLAAAECGDQILAWLGDAMREREHATLAISGGSSPKVMFEMFARTRFDWKRVHLFWVDERGVPPSDEQSNFKLANDSWLTPGAFPKSNVHRVEAELPAAEAAARYADDIRRYFGLAEGELPKFDAIHRGMGPDAHTASLFPGEPMIGNRTDIDAAVWVEKFKQWRITLLPGVLEAARHTAMLVTGADKATPLHAVLHEAPDPLRYPAQIASGERTIWFLDSSAAAEEPAEDQAGADRNQA
jgi:6-phosphogluconolactonase